MLFPSRLTPRLTHLASFVRVRPVLQPSDEHYEANEDMIDRLLDLDDVDSVYCNMKEDEEE